jgi:hypothetical protein
MITHAHDPPPIPRCSFYGTATKAQNFKYFRYLASSIACVEDRRPPIIRTRERTVLVGKTKRDMDRRPLITVTTLWVIVTLCTVGLLICSFTNGSSNVELGFYVSVFICEVVFVPVYIYPLWRESEVAVPTGVVHREDPVPMPGVIRDPNTTVPPCLLVISPVDR